MSRADGAAVRDLTVFVYTQTDQSGFSDPIQADRLKALEFVRSSLDRKKGIALASQADGADVVVEVVKAGKFETGNERTNVSFGVLAGSTRTKKEQKPQVLVTLRSAGYELGFNGTSQKLEHAAHAVADGVEQWIKQNRTKLLEQRGTR